MAKRRSRLRVSLNILTLSRFSTSQPTLVYILTTNKYLKYTYGRSVIAYIGTTKRGLKRIAESVADKAEDVLRKHGVRSLNAHIVTCRGRRGAKVWHKLERALIITFREKHGEVPRCNGQGKGWQWQDELKYFNQASLRAVIDKGAD
jgi:hypothetical protein